MDALTTILDPTPPLTVGEWEEWGNWLTFARRVRRDEPLHAVRERGPMAPCPRSWR